MKRILYINLIIIMFTGQLFAQTPTELFNKANEYHLNGNYKQSDAYLVKTITSLKGTNPRIQSMRVYNNYYLGNYIEARIELEKYLKIVPYKYQNSAGHIALVQLKQEIDEQIQIKEKAFKEDLKNEKEKKMQVAISIENKYKKNQMRKKQESKTIVPKIKFMRR